jgi:hypothetical protein
VSSVYALWTSELTFSANHTAIDNRRKRLCVATFAKQHNFSQIEICKLTCRTCSGAGSTGDTSARTRFFFQQLFVQFGMCNVQIYCCAFVFFISEVYHSFQFSVISFQLSVFSYQFSVISYQFLFSDN